MKRQLIEDRLYALAPLGKISSSFELAGIFGRAAAREGIEILSHSFREDAISFSITQNITFEDMQPVLQTTADAISQTLVLSLKESLMGEDLLNHQDYKNAMADEAIMMAKPKLSC